MKNSYKKIENKKIIHDKEVSKLKIKEEKFQTLVLKSAQKMSSLQV